MPNHKPEWVAFLNEKGEVVQVVDAKDSCNSYEPNDRCGGCGECLLMQAIHYGYNYRAATKEEYEH